MTLPLLHCSEFGNFVITLIYNDQKKKDKELTMIYKTLHRKLKTEQQRTSFTLTNCHVIAEILLKVVLNTRNLALLKQNFIDNDYKHVVKGQRTNNDLHNTTQKTKGRVTQISLKDVVFIYFNIFPCNQ